MSEPISAEDAIKEIKAKLGKQLPHIAPEILDGSEANLVLVNRILEDSEIILRPKAMTQRPVTIHVVPNCKFPLVKFLYETVSWRSNAIESESNALTPFALVGYLESGLGVSKFMLDNLIEDEERSYHLSNINNDRNLRSFLSRLCLLKYPPNVHATIARWTRAAMPVNKGIKVQVSTKCWHHEYDRHTEYPIYMWLVMNNVIVENLPCNDADEIFRKIINTDLYRYGDKIVKIGHLLGVNSDGHLDEAKRSSAYMQLHHTLKCIDKLLQEYVDVFLHERNVLSVTPWNFVEFESESINYYMWKFGCVNQENRNNLTHFLLELEAFMDTAHSDCKNLAPLISNANGSDILDHAYEELTLPTHSRYPYVREIDEVSAVTSLDYGKRLRVSELPNVLTEKLAIEVAPYHVQPLIQAYCTNKTEYNIELQKKKDSVEAERIGKLIELLTNSASVQKEATSAGGFDKLDKTTLSEWKKAFIDCDMFEENRGEPEKHPSRSDEVLRLRSQRAATPAFREQVRSLNRTVDETVNITTPKVRRTTRSSAKKQDPPKSKGAALFEQGLAPEEGEIVASTSGTNRQHPEYFISNDTHFMNDGHRLFADREVIDVLFEKNEQPTDMPHTASVSPGYNNKVSSLTYAKIEDPLNKKLRKGETPFHYQVMSAAHSPHVSEFKEWKSNENSDDMLIVRCGTIEGEGICFSPLTTGLVIANMEVDGICVPTPNPEQVLNVEGQVANVGALPMCLTQSPMDYAVFYNRSRIILQDPAAIKAGVLVTDRTNVVRRRAASQFLSKRIDFNDTLPRALLGGLEPCFTSWIGKEYSYLNINHTTSSGSNKDDLLPHNSQGIKLKAWSPYRICSRLICPESRLTGMLNATEIHYVMSPSVFFGCNVKVERIPNFWKDSSLFNF